MDKGHKVKVGQGHMTHLALYTLLLDGKLYRLLLADVGAEWAKDRTGTVFVIKVSGGPTLG